MKVQFGAKIENFSLEKVKQSCEGKFHGKSNGDSIEALKLG